METLFLILIVIFVINIFFNMIGAIFLIFYLIYSLIQYIKTKSKRGGFSNGNYGHINSL
jgi:hypothetical protein